MSSKLESLKEELVLKDSNLLDKSSKIKNHETENEKLKEKIEDLTNKVNQLSDGNNTAISKYIEDNSSLKSNLQILQDQLDEKIKIIEKIENNSKDSINTINTLKKQHESLQNEISALKTQLLNYETQIHSKDNEINELRGLNTYKDKCIDLSKQIESLEMEIHSLKLQIDDRDTTILDLRSKLKNNESNEEKEQEMLKLQQKLQDEMNNLKND